jgi:hypothetical protein
VSIPLHFPAIGLVPVRMLNTQMYSYMLIYKNTETK